MDDLNYKMVFSEIHILGNNEIGSCCFNIIKFT